MLNDNEHGLECVKKLNGHIHLILGNHDTNERVKLYEECSNIVEIVFATQIKYKKYYFYCSHYPTLVHNYDDYLKIWNLHGHTHSQEKFSEYYHCYNVSLDAHNNYPIELQDIIKNIKEKNREEDKNV